MTLDEAIEICLSYKWDCCGESIEDEILSLLSELYERRESDLMPCDKFLGSSAFDQVKHIKSEFAEVWEAFMYHWQFPSDPKPIGYEKSLEHVVEELVDLQMSCETMLAILGLDGQQRRDARKKVIEKNEARGYYEDVNTK